MCVLLHEIVSAHYDRPKGPGARFNYKRRIIWPKGRCLFNTFEINPNLTIHGMNRIIFINNWWSIFGNILPTNCHLKWLFNWMKIFPVSPNLGGDSDPFHLHIPAICRNTFRVQNSKSIFWESPRKKKKWKTWIESFLLSSSAEYWVMNHFIQLLICLWHSGGQTSADRCSQGGSSSISIASFSPIRLLVRVRGAASSVDEMWEYVTKADLMKFPPERETSTKDLY